MNVLVVADGHYYITPSGDVYADSVYDYNFYKRYLMSFDHVFAVIRAVKVDEVPKNKKKSSGEGITFLLLPQYQGPYQYALKYFSIVRSVKKICARKDIDRAIFRIPAATSNIVAKAFSKTKKPFAVEVVGDPWENFSPRATGNKVMLWVVRRLWSKAVKKLCEKAEGASYVTESHLQAKYPPRAYTEKNSGYFTNHYSSVELADDSFAEPRTWIKKEEYLISHAANYFSDYGKGHKTLIEAVKTVNESGFRVKLLFVGDGPLRKEFEQYANTQGISEKVKFLGRLANGDEVRKAIHNSDIFALPTISEGLPRVVLEAMAEGIPCLSSPTCGVPEILDAEYLYDFMDADGFAQGIISLITNPKKMTQLSKKNIETSKQFSASTLNSRRKEFYDQLRNFKIGG